MESTDKIFTLLYKLSYHLIEMGRYIVNFLIARNWHDTRIDHESGHAPDVEQCPFCRYDREVIEPREALRAAAAFRHRRSHQAEGRDEVD